MRLGFAAPLLAAALGCQGPLSVPAHPTWVDDVVPILRGNCFHCHGPAASTFPKMGVAVFPARWDMYDMSAAPIAALGFTKDAATFDGAKDHAILVTAYAMETPSTPTRMPPPPAEPLSDRDKQTLSAWSMGAKDQGMHNPNHKPTASWWVKDKTILVSDEDQDQVLGRATCVGSTMVQLPFAGTHELPPGAMPPCTVELFDGFEMNSVMLPQ